MDAKQAVAIAKQHFQEVFAEDSSSPPSLEEIWFDHGDKSWNVTLRMHRRTAGALHDVLGANPYGDLKVVSISDKDGTPVSIRNRETAPAWV